MDNVATWKGGVDLSFDREEEEEHLEVAKSIADDFDNYDCFMQPFYNPDEGDEQTKELEIECFDQVDENNSNHQVTNLREQRA